MIHLVVPGLLWPKDSIVEVTRGLELPALQALLGRGRRTRRPAVTAERWLCEAFGIAGEELRELPIGALRLLGEGHDPGGGAWLCADPVHLRFSRNTLVVDAAGPDLAMDEAAQLDPYSYTIAMNAAVGHAKGLRDGAAVWVETETGRRVKGRLRLMQGIHPEGLGIAGCAGHTSEGMPVARGKGVAFNELLEIDWAHVSPVNLNLDLCVRVRVSPVEASR